MKKICIGLLTVALLLGASAPIQAATSKEFWAKHKGKIIAGAAAAAAIGLTAVALGMHANKTDKAVLDAGIKRSNKLDYITAVEIVGLLGPLGKDRVLNGLLKATQINIPFTEKKILTRQEVIELIDSPVGAALAHYFGMEPSVFRGEAAVKGIASEISRGVQAVTENISKAGNRLKRNIKKVMEKD